MKRLNNQSSRESYILPAIVIIGIVFVIGNQNVAADEVPAFFLKIAKNIPRIGRSEQHDEYFKNGNNFESLKVNDDEQWYKDTDPMNEVFKRKVGFAAESDTRAWQHFPLAIEGPPELWRTLAGYSHDPLYRTSDDFNNKLWLEDKRADK